MTNHEVTQRILRHVATIGRRYPEAWAQIDGFRAQRKELGDWPGWCYCPLAGAYAVVSGGRNTPIPPDVAPDIAAVGALSAWRATQGVYRFDPTLLDELWETDLAGEIPVEVLQRLPEWCVYIPTPGRQMSGMAIDGFFAHLEYDANDSRMELRLLLDSPAGLVPIPLHVWVQGGLAAAVGRFAEEAEFQARLKTELGAASAPMFDEARRVAMGAAPLVSLVLYLCSTAAEIRDLKGSDRVPARPRGPMRPANAPTVWEAGFRIGAALRQARERIAAEQGGSHAGPAPHVRRAHWHGYWMGPAADRRLELKWLSPILVGVGDDEHVVPTVRPVRP